MQTCFLVDATHRSNTGEMEHSSIEDQVGFLGDSEPSV